MDKRSEKSPNPEDVKKQLEILAGRNLPTSADLLVKLWYPAGTYSYDDGYACWRAIFSAFPEYGKSCSVASLLDVCGVSSTAGNGQLVFQISQFVCFPPVRALAEPISVVVTPRSADAFFATQTHGLINNNSDVEISVFTWDADGNPAPGISFDWRCRVVSVPIIG
jgi:hypothetical protein